MTTKSVIVRSLEDIQTIVDVCGEIRALSSKEDFKRANVAEATMIAPTTPHYHPIATEFYFVLEGSGRLIIRNRSYEIKEGTLVIIPPDNAHYTIPREITRVLTFSVPAWTKQDQIVLREGDDIAGYMPYQERMELIDEILSRNRLGFEKEMDTEERGEREAERKDFITRNGLNRKPTQELRDKLRIP